MDGWCQITWSKRNHLSLIYIYIYTCSYSPLSSFFRCHSIFFTRIFHCLHLSIVDSLLVLQFGFFMKPVIALDALCRLENELHCFHLVMPSVTYHMKQAEHRISFEFFSLDKKNLSFAILEERTQDLLTLSFLGRWFCRSVPLSILAGPNPIHGLNPNLNHL